MIRSAVRTPREDAGERAEGELNRRGFRFSTTHNRERKSAERSCIASKSTLVLIFQGERTLRRRDPRSRRIIDLSRPFPPQFNKNNDAITRNVVASSACRYREMIALTRIPAERHLSIRRKTIFTYTKN